VFCVVGLDVSVICYSIPKAFAKTNRSFIIQVAGGLMTISTNFKTLQNGLHIYTAGVALQEFFIFCFLFLVFTFQRRMSKEVEKERVQESKRLLFILFASLGLISVSPFPLLPAHPHAVPRTYASIVPYPIPYHRILRRRRNKTDA
jgi:hypothetical protein